MYKLLIVEDEKWEREGLADFLNWSEMNIEIAGTAANGFSGLEMARLHQPHIIITDIRMPVMDGIELIREIRGFSPHCHILITSGYDDFEYAKVAISMGVFGYLLKPIKKDELTDALKRITEDISQEENRKKHIKALNQRLAEDQLEKREVLLQNMIYNRSSKWEDQTPFFSNEPGMVILVIRFGFSPHCKKEEKQDYISAMFRIIARTADENEKVARSTDGLYIILCSPAGRRCGINDVINRILNNFREKDIPLPMIGISSETDAITGIAEAYNQALTAINHLFFTEEENVLHFNDLDRMRESDNGSIITRAIEFSGKMIKEIDSSGSEIGDSLTAEIFGFVRRSRMDRIMVNIFLANFFGELSLRPTGRLEITHDTEEEDITGCLNGFARLSDMEKWFGENLKYKRACVSERKHIKEINIVRSAKEIIRNEYDRSIGIEIIADRMGISPNHLGRIFKEYEGISFTDSLTGFRMEKAKDLLSLERVNVTETAQAVGFNNTAYFCTVFKKKHGISPAEYGKKNSKEEITNEVDY